jgi:hypothetical protein
MSSPRRLRSFPRHRLIPHELLRCRLRELDLLTSVGPATAASDPHSADPRFFWDLEWPCGLVVSVELHQIEEQALVFLDRPELEHALRHLGVDPVAPWVWEEDDPGAFALAVPRRPARAWSVWARDDDGDERCLASQLTERDAHCWVGELQRGRREAGRVHWAERRRSLEEVARPPASADPAGSV